MQHVYSHFYGLKILSQATCNITPTYLPVLPAIPFRHENRSRQQQRPCQSLLPACLWSWHKFEFAGMPAVKTCNVSWAGGVNVLICRNSIAGSTGSYVIGTWMAYENQALFCHAALLHFNLVTEIYEVWSFSHLFTPPPHCHSGLVTSRRDRVKRWLKIIL